MSLLGESIGTWHWTSESLSRNHNARPSAGRLLPCTAPCRLCIDLHWPVAAAPSWVFPEIPSPSLHNAGDQHTLTQSRTHACTHIHTHTHRHTHSHICMYILIYIEGEKSLLLISKVTKAENRNQKDSSNIYKRSLVQRQAEAYLSY